MSPKARKILVCDGSFANNVAYLVSEFGTPYLAYPGNKYSLKGYDLLVLSGGTDVSPSLYGAYPQKPHPYDIIRDKFEWGLVDQAVELGIPVFGICRGHQFLCVYHGGRLVQHLDGHGGSRHPLFCTKKCHTMLE